jgi:SpoVK/Ycf46/Vps4 family AAA+-type ATPase
MEQVIVSQFTEIKRHKPSVIYIPNIEVWHATLHGTVAMVTFQAMLKAIPSTDPVLLLATSECEVDRLDSVLLNEFFGYSKRNRKGIERPEQVCFEDFVPSILC